MATTAHVLMSDEPAQYTGYSKQRSIWETSFSQQDRWAPRQMFGARPVSAVSAASGATVANGASAPVTPIAPLGVVPSGPAAPSPGFDLYYRNAASVGAASAGASGASGAAGVAGATGAGAAPAPAPADDDLIPTAIVVKNIPFAIKKEQLVDVMTQLGLPLPYAFNYHFDNGVFRGLAFANYTTAEETAQVIAALNGREIGGRKLRVEYKKMLPLQERERIEREKRERRGQLEEQHASSQSESSRAASPVPRPRSLSPVGSFSSVGTTSALAGTSPPGLGLAISTAPTIDLNDKETLDLYTSLVLFSAQPASEVTLNRTSPTQRQILVTLCASLGLGLEDRDGKLVVRSSGYAAYPSVLFPH